MRRLDMCLIAVISLGMRSPYESAGDTCTNQQVVYMRISKRLLCGSVCEYACAIQPVRLSPCAVCEYACAIQQMRLSPALLGAVFI
jgi:hypothetical protein